MKTLMLLQMPEEETMEIFDDGAFTVYKTRWDTYSSRDKDGKGICSSTHKEACIYWSREHLNGFQTSTCWTTNVSVTTDALK